MRRVTLFLGALLIAVTLAGCGKDKETEPQTQATQPVTQATQKPTEAPTEKATESSLDKTRELNALVKSVKGDTLEVQTVMGKALSFSTQGAQSTLGEALKQGVQIKILYKGQIEGTDTSKAKISSIEAAGSNDEKITEGQQTERTEADPNAKGGQMAGTIQEITAERFVILADDGDSYYFTLDKAKLNLKNGLQTGNYVTVQYTGDVYGPEIVPAVSVADTTAPVTAPATTEKTSSAEGMVSAVGANSLTITTDDGKELTFTITGAPVSLNNGLITGQYIKVNYTGELSGTDASKVKVASLTDASKKSDTTGGTASDENGTTDENLSDGESSADNTSDNTAGDSTQNDGGTGADVEVQAE